MVARDVAPRRFSFVRDNLMYWNKGFVFTILGTVHKLRNHSGGGGEAAKFWLRKVTSGGGAAWNCAYFLVVAAKPPSRRVVSGEAADYVVGGATAIFLLRNLWTVP